MEGIKIKNTSFKPLKIFGNKLLANIEDYLKKYPENNEILNNLKKKTQTELNHLENFGEKSNIDEITYFEFLNFQTEKHLSEIELELIKISSIYTSNNISSKEKQPPLTFQISNLDLEPDNKKKFKYNDVNNKDKEERMLNMPNYYKSDVKPFLHFFSSTPGWSAR